MGLHTTSPAGGGPSGGHTISEDGVPVTQRAGLNFVDGFTVTDDPVNDETEVVLDSPYALIHQTVVGAAGAANVDITTIPVGYENLELVIMGRSGAAVTNTPLMLRFNNDSAANYFWQRDGSYAGTSGGASQANGEAGAALVTAATIGEVTGASAPAGSFGSTRCLIPAYGRAIQKATLSNTTCRYAATDMTLFLFGNAWLSTAAIDRITVYPSSGSFVENTVVSLYGIKGA